MQDQEKREEREAAEDFRQQLQERTLRNPVLTREQTLGWIEERREYFEQIMTEMLGDEAQAKEFVRHTWEALKDVALPGEADDLLTHSVVDAHSKEIEEACKNLEIPLRSGVAYGSTQSLQVEATRYAVHFTEASVISLSAGFILFCSDLSKVLARSLPMEEKEGGFELVIDPDVIYTNISGDKDLKVHWTEVVGGYAYGRGALNVRHRIVPYPASITRQQLLWAMERFAVAHEYAHHTEAHGKRGFAAKQADNLAFQEELDADAFGLEVSRYVGLREPLNLWVISGAGAVLLLKALESVRRARQVLLTGDDVLNRSITHPDVSDRIKALNDLDAQLPESLRNNSRHLREKSAELMDLIWPRLKRYFALMHENGLRPMDSPG